MVPWIDGTAKVLKIVDTTIPFEDISDLQEELF